MSCVNDCHQKLVASRIVIECTNFIQLPYQSQNNDKPAEEVPERPPLKVCDRVSLSWIACTLISLLVLTQNNYLHPTQVQGTHRERGNASSVREAETWLQRTHCTEKVPEKIGPAGQSSNRLQQAHRREEEGAEEVDAIQVPQQLDKPKLHWVVMKGMHISISNFMPG